MSGPLPERLPRRPARVPRRVRGRAFVITTALLALAVIGIIFVPTILAAVGVADPATVAVVVEAEICRSMPCFAALEAAPATAGGETSEPEVVAQDDADAAG